MYHNKLFYYLYAEQLLSDDILNKYHTAFTNITPELNNYFLYSVSENEKNYLHLQRSQFLIEIYKFNENKIATDKKFVLEYIQYVPITNIHFNVLIQIYPELIQTNISNISDITFVKNFYKKIIEFNSDVITKEFINKYYQLFISDIISKESLKILSVKPVFFKLHPVMQQKIKNYFNS